jgi:hypothetical protein
LHRVFHPTAEQRARELAALRHNLEHLRGALKNGDEQRKPAESEGGDQPDSDQEFEPRTSAPEREVVDLLGLTLWDVFSNNHEVRDRDGVVYDIGSFRGSAGFLADALDERYTELECSYDYLDFYMGTVHVEGRADLRPVYRWIFGRLLRQGCTWRYSFPRLYLFRFEKEPDDDFTQYDPSEAVRAESDRVARDAQTGEMRERLERDHDDSVRRARKEPLPPIVAAYRDVFGEHPEGWPHPDM